MKTTRRNLLQLGSIAVGAGVLTQLTHQAFNSASFAVDKQDNSVDKSSLTPDECLNSLIEGNKRFITNQRKFPNQDLARIKDVAEGQFPFAALLSCADSRVPVEILFDQGFGDLFVVRDAGNIATPEEIGSLEFGTSQLGAKVILVLGHEECGAVKAALAGKPLPGRIGSIAAAIAPSITEKNPESPDYVTDAIKRNVLHQIDNLKTSPVLSQLIKEGKLRIAGGYYDLDTAEVQIIS